MFSSVALLEGSWVLGPVHWAFSLVVVFACCFRVAYFASLIVLLIPYFHKLTCQATDHFLAHAAQQVPRYIVSFVLLIAFNFVVESLFLGFDAGTAVPVQFSGLRPGCGPHRHGCRRHGHQARNRHGAHRHGFHRSWFWPHGWLPRLSCSRQPV